jgi:GNAT superfamily N-acetyltransferase
MAAVNAAGWRQGYRDIVPAHYLERLPVSRWLEEMRAGLREPRGDSFTRIAELDGAFAGYCFVAAPGREQPEDSRKAELVALYVDPDRWGRGVGRALLERSLADVGARGYSLIELWTFSRNERALRLYRATGFAADGATRPFEPLGIETIRMSRTLGEWPR